MLFLPALSVLSSGNSLGECSMPVLFRKCSFVFYSHMELVDTSPTDFQRVFGEPMPQVGAIKIVVLGVQSKPFTAQGSWELEIPF